MANSKKLIEGLKVCLALADQVDNHCKKLVNELTHLEPSHNTVKAQLANAGFSSETTNEDNLKLLLVHHTSLVAENTRLNKIITDRDALMEQLREVVLESVD